MTERELGIVLTKIEALHEDILELKKLNETLAKRTSSLESFRAWASGAGALVVMVMGAVVQYLGGK